VALDEQIIEIEERARDLRLLLNDTIREAQEKAEGGDLPGTADQMVDLLEVIKALKADVREIDNEANPTLVTIMDRMNTRKFDRGSLTVEKRVSNYRTNWQNKVLIRAVVNTALDEIAQREYLDQETGEFVSERAIVAPWMDAVVERLLACAAFRDWRVTALRAHIPGVDPDSFCDVKRSVKAVIGRVHK